MTLWWLLVLLGILLIGLTKSGFGSGVGLFNVPLIVLAMGHTSLGSEAALGLMLPLLILGDLIAIWQYRDLILPVARAHPAPQPVSVDGETIAPDAPLPDPPDAPPAAVTGPWLLRYLWIGTLAGVVLGAGLLWWFHTYERLVGAFIRVEIGIESVLLVGLHWYRQAKGMQHTLLPEPLRGTLTGAFAGISSTLAHAAGPILAMYLLPLQPPRRLFVGTCALYFFLLNTAKLPAYVMSGMFARIDLALLGMMAPLVFIGAAIGFWINRRLSDRVFSQIIYIATFALGIYLLFDGMKLLLTGA